MTCQACEERATFEGRIARIVGVIAGYQGNWRTAEVRASVQWWETIPRDELVAAVLGQVLSQCQAIAKEGAP